MRSLRSLRFLLGTAGVALFFAFGAGFVASAGEPRTNQQWVSDSWRELGAASGGDGARVLMHVRHVGPSKCLGIALPSGQGASGILWECDGNSVQSFTQHDNRDQSWTFSVVDKATGKRYCLDADNSGHLNGAVVAFYSCSGSKAQKWVVGREDQLQSVQSPGKCLDDTDRETKNGTRIQLWDCAGSPGPVPATIRAGTPAPAPAPAVTQSAGEQQRQPAEARSRHTGSHSKAAASPAEADASASGPSSASSVPATRTDASAPRDASVGVPAPAASRSGPAETTEHASPSLTLGASGHTLAVSLAAFVVICGLVMWRLMPWPLALAAVHRLGAAVTKRRGTAVSPDTATLPAQQRSALPANADKRTPQPIGSPEKQAPTRLEPPAEAPLAGGKGSAAPAGPSQPTGTAERGEGQPLEGGMFVAAPGFPDEPAALAPWWTPDPAMFAVFVSHDAAAARFRDGATSLGPLELAERVRGHRQWDRQPVMLVTDGDPGGGVVQLIADYLQVPVITGSHLGMWLAVSPRRADRGRTPVIHLGRVYPFTEEQKEELGQVSHLPRVLPPTGAVTAIEADEHGCALVVSGQPGADELLEGLRVWRSDAATSGGGYGVAVRADTGDPDCLIRVGDDTRTVWDAAEALWETREHWEGEGRTPTVLTTSPLPEGDLRLGLLSAYLRTTVRGAPLAVAPGRTNPAVPGAESASPVASGAATGHEDGGDAVNNDEVSPETGGQALPTAGGGRSAAKSHR